jgi:hypothetical protein
MVVRVIETVAAIASFSLKASGFCAVLLILILLHDQICEGPK